MSGGLFDAASLTARADGARMLAGCGGKKI
jgi:hypothetical protein